MSEDRAAGRRGGLHRGDERVDSAAERGYPACLHELAAPIDDKGVERGKRGAI